jgi:acetyl-CoA synthetase
VITADQGVRGGKAIPLKANTDEALAALPQRPHRGSHGQSAPAETSAWDGMVGMFGTHDLTSVQSRPVSAEPCRHGIRRPAVHLVHLGLHRQTQGRSAQSSAGYLLHAAISHKYVFDYQDGDIYWCTADVGWITGHSYIVYGPLANAATTLMFEGVPTYPDRCTLLANYRQTPSQRVLHGSHCLTTTYGSGR